MSDAFYRGVLGELGLLIQAWAIGKPLKIRVGSKWEDITPDTMKVKIGDHEWVSVREAIKRWDERDEAPTRSTE
jgi:hypothetical protein